MLTEEEVGVFLRQNTPKNTVKKTECDVRRFNDWVRDQLPNERRKMEDFPPSELNDLLRTFFIKVRRLDGKEYEPDSLKAMQNSFDRYLGEKGYDCSLLRDHVFKGSRLVMDAKRKNLKHEGLGRKPNRAGFLDEDEEEVLWSSGQLGAHNAVSLQNTIWWRNNFFGLRGRQEHRDMRWGDLIVQTDTNGVQYIEYHERDTKTRKDPRNERAFPPKLFATPDKPERCPVQMLLLFSHKRPIPMLEPDSPFYLTPLPDSQMKPNTWFKSAAMGIHSLSNIMKNMCEKAGLSGKLTNHSGRKTTVKRLREAGIESTDIIQLTGHKNVQSVNSYSNVSVQKQIEMSSILVKPQSVTSTSSTVTVPSTSTSLNENSTENGNSVDSYSIDFDPNDGFDEVIASIEQFESPTVKRPCNPQQDQTKSLMSNSHFSGCTINFSINYNN